MINKYALLVILVLFSYQLNANEISGTSGDVIAVMTDEGEVNALSYKYNQSEYLILGLPYVYQTSVKKIGDISINETVSQEDFIGFSRTRWENVPKVRKWNYELPQKAHLFYCHYKAQN